jgi:hypothetical protein
MEVVITGKRDRRNAAILPPSLREAMKFLFVK